MNEQLNMIDKFVINFVDSVLLTEADEYPDEILKSNTKKKMLKHVSEIVKFNPGNEVTIYCSLQEDYPDLLNNINAETLLDMLKLIFQYFGNSQFECDPNGDQFDCDVNGDLDSQTKILNMYALVYVNTIDFSVIRGMFLKYKPEPKTEATKTKKIKPGNK